MLNWLRYYGTFEPDESKQVDFVDFQISVDDGKAYNEDRDVEVPIYFTDIQFQAGSNLSGWVPNTQEMLRRLTHVNDENTKVPSNSIFEGSVPTSYDMQTRVFNIVGRGNSEITLPNFFPENWDLEILPTGINFTLFAKEDFDVARISTGAGAFIPEGEERTYDTTQMTKGTSQWNYYNEHPLHTRYTREFWIDGKPAGTEIKIHASTRLATVGGQDVQLAGVRHFNINGYPLYIGRNRFFLAPYGAVRFRIEFYKQVPDPFDGSLHLKDIGIGFYGFAEFMQWTYGNGRY